MTKPNFLIIGAGRCGTTSLYDLFCQHPKVFMSVPKEIGFFTEFFERGWDWYEKHFRNATGATAIGEATVNYSKAHVFPEAAKRIIKYLPDAKLIYITRNPLKRIVSEWKFRRVMGEESRPFNEAILENDDYCQTSNYRQQLKYFQDDFPEGRILVLFLEDLKQYPDKVLEQCWRFLEVEQLHGHVELQQRNASMKAIRPGHLIRLLWRCPGYDFISHAIPDKLKQRIKSLMGTSAKKIPELEQPIIWGRQTLEKTATMLLEDTEKFLAEHNKPLKFWDLSALDCDDKATHM